MVYAQQKLQSIIQAAVESCGFFAKSVRIEKPADTKHGDYATNVALLLAKQENAKPQELATKIVQQILAQNEKILEKVEIADPGFINFYLSKKTL